MNGLRVEHYAVDSGSLAALRLVLERGGDVHAEDEHGWTPLFRAREYSTTYHQVDSVIGTPTLASERVTVSVYDRVFFLRS